MGSRRPIRATAAQGGAKPKREAAFLNAISARTSGASGTSSRNFRCSGTGGIGRIEGPIVGTIVFFALRQTLADLDTIYLLMLGAVAILVMLAAPKGICGLIIGSFGWQVFPLERSVVLEDRRAASKQKSDR
jgi:hypothetical protein